MYKLVNFGTVQRLSDGAFIPDDPRNQDRQKYDAWVAEGNVPMAADIKRPELALTSEEKLIQRTGFTKAELKALLG